MLNQPNKEDNSIYSSSDISDSSSANSIPSQLLEGNDLSQITNTNSLTQTYSNKSITSFGLKEKGLKLANLNIGRLQIYNPKFDDLKMLVNQNNRKNVDVFGICETWLKDELDENLKIEGFNFERKDRRSITKTKGGGILVYVNNSFEYKTVFKKFVF